MNEIQEMFLQLNLQITTLTKQVCKLVELAESEAGKRNENILSEQDVCLLLNCTANTLASYRTKRGMPYIIGKPCKYEKDKIIEWYNLYKNKNNDTEKS